MTRILAALLVAVLPFGAMAAGHSKAHVAKLSNAEFTKDGEPNLQSSGVLVLDPTTGQTLFSKNADTAAPIASLTKLMTAMVVLDANLNMDEAIEITREDVDTFKNSTSRLPVGSHFRREDLLRLALMASDNRAAAATRRARSCGLDTLAGDRPDEST